MCVLRWIAAFLLCVSLPAGAAARELIRVIGGEPGTIVIKTQERRLYYVVREGLALRYPVAVGKPGKDWTGVTRIDGKYVRPAWSPPPEMRHDNPSLPDVIPGGARNNPMGERALTLKGDKYAIHGTYAARTVGTAASWGCFRMHNRHIVELFDMVAVGTPVVVMQ
jgi:lipoprotein-anchoring transpeptidase ErfK/SrfK